MKKKLALLMAAIMTVAMVPMTAFAAAKTDMIAVDQLSVAVDENFTSTVELKRDEKYSEIDGGQTDSFEVYLTLTNGKFAKDGDDYIMEKDSWSGYGVIDVDVKSDTKAILTLRASNFNKNQVVIPIDAKAVAVGDVVATFTTNKTLFADVSDVIATAYDGDVAISTEGVVTFVEDADEDVKDLKDITIDGIVNDAIDGAKEIKLKLKGNYKFNINDKGWLLDDTKKGAFEISFLNSNAVAVTKATENELTFTITGLEKTQLTKMLISNLEIVPTKKCSAGDVATITVSSKNFDSVKLEVAKMVEEAVTYTVEDKDLPTIWAGKAYDADDTNTLKVSIEENAGDILNTSRKATFTFPEGIEIVDAEIKGYGNNNLYKDIDENVLTIKNYSKNTETTKTDLDVKFTLNAAPTFSGDVKVTLGGEFDDVEFKVATVKAPYTIEAKTSEVLIDYRYVPVNEIVITEAEEGILEENDEIVLEVEKMDFEDAGSYEVTEGDIDVKVDIDGDDKAQLKVTVKDDSTEASTIVISGLELYLDRTLPVGGYALDNVFAHNILWENSVKSDKDYDGKAADADDNGLFKYKAVTCNDSYVEVVTQARDQDDYTTNRKIVITIGATTMAVGTETVTLDAPAYINAENYTELPLRAVSEAFGATVAWDDASRTVTVMMGQRIVSMTIGSKTMYINGTPVAMNTAPEITADRTFVPVRDLANALGISKIDWNEAAATVTDRKSVV